MTSNALPTKIVRRFRTFLARLSGSGVPQSKKDLWSSWLGARLNVADNARISSARLVVRDPDECRLRVGEGSILECTVVLERSGAAVAVGARSFVGGDTMLAACEQIEIGDDVLVSFQVLIVDHDSHAIAFELRKDDVRNWLGNHKDWTHVARAPVRIGNKAWIGARSIILKGVTIGEGAVVGAGSVVTRNVLPWNIVAGNPARVIGSALQRNVDLTIEL